MDSLELFPYQVEDAKKLKARGWGLLTSEPGTGKTPVALAAIPALPVLIVCPNMVKDHWVTHAQNVGLEAVSLHGTPKTRRVILETNPECVVVGYSMLTKHSRISKYGRIPLSAEDRESKELNKRFKTVIFDEAHALKNPQTDWTRAAWALADEAEHVFCLTGTPISNSPMDLWALLRACRQDLFPASTRFYERYALEEIDVYGYTKVVGIKPKMLKEYQTLVQAACIRRTKAECLPDLPAKTYETYWVELPPTQRRVYKEMETHFRAQIEDEKIFATSALPHLTRLLQFSSATPVLKDGEVVGLQRPSCKVDALLEILEKETGPLVVFMESRKLLDLCASVLEEQGISHGSIRGNLRPEQGKQIISTYMAGETRVLLVLLSAGAEGLTLTAGNTAVFLQRSYSLTRSLQAEDRIHRIGQFADKVRIIDVVTRDTAEEKLHDVVLGKEDLLLSIVGDTDKLRRALS